MSDCLPIAFARRPPLSATHVIVSDCRWRPDDAPENGDRLIYIRPQLSATGTLRAPSSTLVAAVRQGTAAVTGETQERLEHWRRIVGADSASRNHPRSIDRGRS